ncbi:hypothetical protein KC19_5G184400 [Ceratodon purpureus]|uniref:Transmembrane protein n=1 Tax=Ceratodon purpureus TaxID=3225 RepID=A0A8T0I4J4_CERPU|nr:hypothetical protein KC19_5G184400 [Ceratodon purpureus]
MAWTPSSMACSELRWPRNGFPLPFPSLPFPSLRGLRMSADPRPGWIRSLGLRIGDWNWIWGWLGVSLLCSALLWELRSLLFVECVGVFVSYFVQWRAVEDKVQGVATWRAFLGWRSPLSNRRLCWRDTNRLSYSSFCCLFVVFAGYGTSRVLFVACFARIGFTCSCSQFCCGVSLGNMFSLLACML